MQEFFNAYLWPFVFGWLLPIGLLVLAITGLVRSLTDHFVPRRAIKQIKRHFKPVDVQNLTTSARKFSARVRPDLQQALEQFISQETQVACFAGIGTTNMFGGVDFQSLLDASATLVPPQYDDVNIGEQEPIRCLKSGLWLLGDDHGKYAVICGAGYEHTPRGMHAFVAVQVASSDEQSGKQFSQRLFQTLERALARSPSYRGKILSLEVESDFFGTGGEVTVHKLNKVRREELILPSETLVLLERNILSFVEQRERLGARNLSRKKGVLFYGPPGTGKTHCIHYLAGELKNHTTLLISAEQVALLSEYMTLARLLQPSLVVIEDADLIARERSAMNSPCEEALLNKLLNEMDGLRPDAEVLFILTTNRPQAIEPALAARPGRIDQAIEFANPDDASRRKLIKLYGSGLRMSDELIETIARKTAGVSASFIKELMRRSTQFQLERDGEGEVSLNDIDQALDEMLFSGGSLNRMLLGARGEEVSRRE